MFSFLPARTPILVLITRTQRNTTPYVVVSGVELISDTFTVYSTYTVKYKYVYQRYIYKPNYWVVTVLAREDQMCTPIQRPRPRDLFSSYSP